MNRFYKLFSLSATFALVIGALLFLAPTEGSASDFVYGSGVEVAEDSYAQAFPDANFRAEVLRMMNGDGGNRTSSSIIDESDLDVLAQHAHLDVSYMDISDMTGLAYFTGLMSLNCENNQLTVLDVSQNTMLMYLYCNNNQLTVLDVSNNNALRYLYCNSNQLAALDVSNSTALSVLYCDGNQIAWIDVSNSTELVFLSCSDNLLSALDVSHNTLLRTFSCGRNQLTVLDVSNNTVLSTLYCAGNQLTELDVSNNTELNTLSCTSNLLTTLDVSQNTRLVNFDCGYNQLTTLDVSHNTLLHNLYCYFNELYGLDLSGNAALSYLWCFGNYMASPDNVIGWQELGLVINSPVNVNSGTFQFYSQKQLPTYLSEFPDNNFRAEVLRLMNNEDGGNRISVSAFTMYDLNMLASFTSLNVNNMIMRNMKGLKYFCGLQYLNCADNQLTALDVSNNSALQYVDCRANYL